MTLEEFLIGGFYPTNPVRFQSVDTDIYDIVEKPDYKKKRLTKEINNLRKQIDNYSNYAIDLSLELKRKEKELEELNK